jgi:sirohydrochlorin cobaltochelatase
MDWNAFKKNRGGLLVVGHGTRRADGVGQLLTLTLRMQQLLPDLPIEASFLELAEPTISTGLSRLKDNGAFSVVVVPVLLFEAGHAKSDIPDAVNDAASKFGMRIVGQSSPLGTTLAALELSARRFREAMRCTHISGCLRAGGCDRARECFGQFDSTIATTETLGEPGDASRLFLAMVGRGTSDETALNAMRHFSRLRIEGSEFMIDGLGTGFFAGGRPTVDELLSTAKSSGARTVVVQPHLLFEGELIEQLRQKVETLKIQNPSQRWLVTMPLGSDTALAETFLALAMEKVRKIAVIGDML